jgi:hypothetical protein
MRGWDVVTAEGFHPKQPFSSLAERVHGLCCISRFNALCTEVLPLTAQRHLPTGDFHNVIAVRHGLR